MKWASFREALRMAGVIIVDDIITVRAEVTPDPDSVGLVAYSDGELYCLLTKEENERVDVCDSEVWAVPHSDGGPIKMAFYRSWMVQDDTSLEPGRVPVWRDKEVIHYNQTPE
tara:strand:- start:6991 stop:7329 length:339 start_codon:yes stop_codon:yes gene_type:complete